ncbi:uncharacterized protein PHACADRAFT_260777 [Phanerochaete carnosa HHB-10118-sp]|uniref:F-box domain-containing protein n=1 Tax=Phanerochaete carnosa (strain HHB-10118-sp) TaxID=650164 RepID=K5W0L9_PHACS|nr:uncharacterized protein PHACADRAFT_260777 [Phanerochaete carnosa HHB-10118-sp]EKM52414.1 hypothetical protein PHACADRAFT_260777 [Phanerochaete carnosa HHB-10118-sp]
MSSRSSSTMPSVGPQDELTAAVSSVVESLKPLQKARFLLDHVLKLIESGRYNEEAEKYLEVYLRTPGLSNEDKAKALLARGNAQRMLGERMLARAQQDFQAVANLDPTNRELQLYLRRGNIIHFVDEPASHRAPPEVWDRIARFIPRYHLRTWLFVSRFHRNIAVRIIFHTLDLYFGEDQDNPRENLNRGLDIFDRVKADPAFARQIKVLRLHWAYEEGDMLDLMTRIFRTTLPAFTSLKEFEWIGYPELRADMVQSIFTSHPHLHALGLIGWHFDAVGVSGFRSLCKFTLRAEDDDGFADMGEVRTVLDMNESTLRHLTLGAYLQRTHSWDSAFQSATIRNLTHLDLVDTRISHTVLARIAHAHNLQSLTLHGTFEEPSAASVVFGSDHIIGDKHTFLPHLQEFRFVMIGHDDEWGLFQSVTQFLKARRRLRRLDLGSCPWELVHAVLPDLVGLRVLRVRIANLSNIALNSLLACLPREMVAIHLSSAVSEKPMHRYSSAFRIFHALSILHLHQNCRRPQPNLLSDKDFQVQTEFWHASLRSIALNVPSVDFVGWHGEHYVVVRGGEEGGNVEMKELPARRKLDCGKGVDLGGDDAAWLERKDVPMDYEMSGLEA